MESTDDSKPIIQKKLEAINNYLITQGLSLTAILGEKEIAMLGISKHLSFFQLKHICSYFSNLSIKDIKDDSIQLPSDLKDLKLEQKTSKLRVLNKWLSENQSLDLARAVSYSEATINKILSGNKLPSRKLLASVSDYFFLDVSVLSDDDKELPPLEELKINNDLASVQRQDFKAVANRNSQKHIIRRNWRIISHPKRIQLILSSLAIFIPLIAFTAYCSYVEIQDRTSTISKYSDDEMSSYAKEIEAYVDQNPTDYTTTVRMGSLVSDIVSITSSSYTCDMTLWFDFDQLSFHDTIVNLNSEVKAYETRLEKLGGYSEEVKDIDVLTYNSDSNVFYSEPDGIPDFLECNLVSMSSSLATFEATFTEATREQLDALTVSPINSIEMSCYPGQTQSNNYADNANMWSLERGGFNADSFSYDLMTPYTLADSDSTSFRMFQKCSFSGSINTHSKITS
ncbi:MAG: helix-turn-helix transcriptional regulator [Bacilli bacterium]